MAVRSGDRIERALLAKGFRREMTHHRYRVLHVAGKPTSVRTFVSHGRKEYGDDLLGRVRQQLGLERKQDLLRLLDCPMEYEEYVEGLRERGLV